MTIIIGLLVGFMVLLVFCCARCGAQADDLMRELQAKENGGYYSAREERIEVEVVLKEVTE